MNRLLFSLLIFFIVSAGFGQYIIRGKITDNTGEALIGATVVLKSNKASGAAADLEGNYTLKVADTSAQVLVVSYVGYKSQEETVPSQKKGAVYIKDFLLVSSSTLDEVVVTSKVVKANSYYMDKLKMNSSVTMDYISQETMKKTGDVNVVNAVARVPGVTSSASSGTITVRGIGDRYIRTTMNGSRIPSLDPYSNSIRLDLFPSTLIDNIVLAKTASPELPGDWAGAYISIDTKDYPDKFSVNAETNLGYNPQSTFKSVLSSQHSSTEWLGYDNSLRPHSNNPNGPSAIANLTPSTYQQFVALGLGDYYQSLGVNSSNWLSTSQANQTYYNLGLVQLGLLNSSQLGDANAVAQATANYNNGPYKSQAIANINAASVKLGQSFKDNWEPIKRTRGPNFSQNFSIGNQVNLFGRPLGFIAGFRYSSITQYDPNASANRIRSDGGYEAVIKQQSTVETNAWSALANVAYKYRENHSISLLFMPNFNGTNQVRNSVDYSDPQTYNHEKTQFYEQRRQLIYQLKSEHYIPTAKLKIEGHASYTDGKSSSPDFKLVQYTQIPGTEQYQLGQSVGLGEHRYFRYLTDNVFDSRLNLELPIGDAAKAGPRKLKFGGAYQFNGRKTDFYDYQVNDNIQKMNGDNLDNYFALSNFALTNDKLPLSYVEGGSPANHIFGKSTITAAYLMTDYSIYKRLKLSGGVRMEWANIYTDAHKFDSLHYAANDPRRNYSSSLPLLNPGGLNTMNVLPSGSLIYKLINNEEAPLNLRLNYSQTLARPSMRELSDIGLYDYFYRSYIFGNSDLKPVSVRNYDLRLEWYFKNRDNVSVSVFYKSFRNNIVLINTGNITWINVDTSHVQGIELDGKKSINKYFDVMANLTLVQSNASYVLPYIEFAGGEKVYKPIRHVSQPMFGQSPYIVNVILSYTAPEKLGLNATLSFNRQGKRLVLIQASSSIPDVYEMPRNMLDFKVTKKLGKRFSAGLTVYNIFNASYVRSYVGAGTNVAYDKFTYGTSFVGSLIYKL